MKGLWKVLYVGLVLGVAPILSVADEGPVFVPQREIQQLNFQPSEIQTVSADVSATPVLQPIPESEPVPMVSGCELFPCVTYKNKGKVAPCAVEMIVSVKRPCACKTTCGCNPCNDCVNVKICVPPCNDCPKVKIRKCGDKVIYDYGKYAIELTTKKTEVVVAYHK